MDRRTLVMLIMNQHDEIHDYDLIIRIEVICCSCSTMRVSLADILNIIVPDCITAVDK